MLFSGCLYHLFYITFFKVVFLLFSIFFLHHNILFQYSCYFFLGFLPSSVPCSSSSIQCSNCQSCPYCVLCTNYQGRPSLFRLWTPLIGLIDLLIWCHMLMKDDEAAAFKPEINLLFSYLFMLKCFSNKLSSSY